MKRLCIVLAALALCLAVAPDAEARGCRGRGGLFHGRVRGWFHNRRSEGRFHLLPRNRGGCQSCEAEQQTPAPELIQAPSDEAPEVRFASQE